VCPRVPAHPPTSSSSSSQLAQKAATPRLSRRPSPADRSYTARTVKGDSTIRTLAQILLTLILAALVVVAGAVTIFAVTRTEPKQTKIEPGRPSEIPGNAVPKLDGPLPALYEPITVPKLDTSESRGKCQVQVTGQNPGSKPLVVAIFDHPAGIRHSSVNVDRLPKTLTFDHLPVGQYRIVIARSLQCARLAYLQRLAVEIAEAGTAKVQLSCDVRALSLALAPATTSATKNPPTSVAGIPVLLHRVDDPNWRYRKPDSQHAQEAVVRSNQTGRVVFQDLGPGRYRLEMHGFEPIKDDVARLTFELGSFDASQPIRGQAR